MPAFDDPYTKFERRTRSPATDESRTRVPWPCARSRFDERDRDRNRSGEVGLHDLERRGRVVLGPGLVAQHAERDEDEIEVAEAIERGTHEVLVRGEVGGVERDRMHLRRARLRATRPRRRRRPRACAPRARPAPRRRATILRTVASAMSEVPPSTSTDCTSPNASFIRIAPSCPIAVSYLSPPVAAEIEAAVHVAAQQAVRDRAWRGWCANRRGAGTSPRAAPGAAGESLVRYTRPPACTTSSSSPSSSGARPGEAGMSSASVQPDIGNPMSERLSCSKRLSTARKVGTRAALKRSSAVRTTCSAPNGTTNWYCTKPRGPYTRFQSRTPSSGKKNGLMPSTCRRRVPRRLAVPDLVEGLDAQQVDQAVRQPRRRRRAACAARMHVRSCVPRRGRSSSVGVVAAGQHRPPEVTAGREAVDPRHRVLVVVVAVEHARHAVVDVGRAFGVAHDPRRLDRLQLERRVGDDAGETHAAARRPERLRVGVGIERARALRRGDDPHPLDVVGERSVAELAVDVGGDRAADRDVARPRDDHREPTQREQHAQQRVEAHAALDGDGALVDVDREDRVEVAARQHVAAGVLRGVAVGTTQAPRDHAARARRGDLGDDVFEDRPVGARSRASARCAPNRRAVRDAAGSATVMSRTVHREREEDRPQHTHQQEDAIGEHEILGRAAAALLEQRARSAGCRARTERSTARTTRGCRPSTTSRTPRGSTRGSSRSTTTART